MHGKTASRPLTTRAHKRPAGQRLLLAGAALGPMLFSPLAQAADVNVTTNVTTGVNLDAQVGSTVDVAPGVSVSNAALSNAVKATTAAWGLTNRGSITSSNADTVTLSVSGSSVNNSGAITATNVANAVRLTGGGSVTNQAGGTITANNSAVIIGASGGPAGAAGTLVNAGTITQTGTAGDLVQLLFGGTLTNQAGGVISANNGSNAASVGQGASRTVINAGTITNTGTGFATGVLVQGGASTVNNSATGRISGSFNGVFASSTSPLNLTNDGLIETTGSKASSYGVEGDGGGVVVNTGTIRSAASDGLFLKGAATVTNRGTIAGAARAITFSGAATHGLVLDTGSVLTGQVQGGTGTDSLTLNGTGQEDLSKFLSFETMTMNGSSWRLTGAGSISATSEVQSGLLDISGALTTPVLNVAAGGSLTGAGSVSGAVNLSGHLIADSSHVLTLGSLAMGAGSSLDVTLGAPSGSRLVNVTGALTLDGAVQVTQAPGFGVGIYRLIDYGGALTDNGLDIGSVPAGSAADYSIQTSVTGQVNLVRAAPAGPFNFWDGAPGNANNGKVDGGSGTWNATLGNWTKSDGSANGPITPQPGFAIFQAAPGVVTIDNSLGQVSITGMQFAADGYRLTGGAIDLSTAQTPIRVGDGSQTGGAFVATLDAALIGTGGLEKTDLGTLILNGANTFTGASKVSAGRLLVNGSAASSAFDVASGATLGGAGTLGSLSAQTGSIVAPGNGVGALNVTGDYTAAAGSIYRAELTSAGANDELVVLGKASVTDGALINVVKTDAAPYVLGTRYRVLTAGSVTGNFSLTGDTAVSPFVSLRAVTDPTHVYIDIAKTRAFAAAALDDAQTQAGRSLDSAPIGSSLVAAVALLPSDAAARAALNQISGEIHPSSRSVLMDDSRLVRSAALDRLSEVDGSAEDSSGLWGRWLGARADWDADRGAAALRRSVDGGLVGLDGRVGQGRIGMFGGYSQSTIRIPARASAARDEAYDLGVYGAWTSGQLIVRVGAAQGWHSLTTNRLVAFTGFTDRLTAKYDGSTSQAFTELAYQMGDAWEPFANLAYVRTKADSFTEAGGAAALHGAAEHDNAGLSTLGVRGHRSFSLGSSPATIQGALAWRHNFNSDQPSTRLNLAGGLPVAISGLGPDRDTANLDLSLQLNPRPGLSISVGYGGQIGSRTQDNSVEGRIHLAF